MVVLTSDSPLVVVVVVVVVVVWWFWKLYAHSFLILTLIHLSALTAGPFLKDQKGTKKSSLHSS
ncbi:hypothetical protein V0R55_08590, partial [Pseudomonas soli]